MSKTGESWIPRHDLTQIDYHHHTETLGSLAVSYFFLLIVSIQPRSWTCKLLSEIMICFAFLRQCLTMWFMLLLNSLCSSGCLEFTAILLPHLPECWEDRCVPLLQAWLKYFTLKMCFFHNHGTLQSGCSWTCEWIYKLWYIHINYGTST